MQQSAMEKGYILMFILRECANRKVLIEYMHHCDTKRWHFQDLLRELQYGELKTSSATICEKQLA